MSEMKGFSSTVEELNGSDQDKVAFFERLHEAAADQKKFIEWDWYLYENIYRGNHYMVYDKLSGIVEIAPSQPRSVRLTVNKVYSILRAIRNFATSSRPKWEVIANDTAEEIINSSKRAADMLDYYYDYLNMPTLIKGATLHAAKFGVGIFQYGWDDEAEGIDGQEGEAYVIIRDPFDVYFDPSGMLTGDVQNCRYLDVVVSKPKDDLLNNKHYKSFNISEITSDDKYAASEQKNKILTDKYSGQNSSSTEENESLLLHETWYKKRVKNKETGKMETQICVISWVKGHLLREEVTEFTEYPFIIFSSDNNPLEFYGEGYVKNLVPIIKTINRLESQLVEYNNIVNVGRYVTDNDSGYNMISDVTGEIIEKNPGSEFRELRPGGLAPDIHNQINRLLDYMDDISGVTDAFKGTTPSGVTAGVAIEALQAKSANNLEDLKSNLEEALAKLGRGLLVLVASKVVAPRKIRSVNNDYNSDEDYDQFEIQGAVGFDPKEELKKNRAIIGPNNKVRVTIGSGIAYTMEGRWNRIKELHSMFPLPIDAILEAVEWPDLRNVVQRAKEAQVDQAMLSNLEKNGMPGMGMPPGGAPGMEQGMPPQGAEQMPPQEQPQDDWVQLAIDEGQAILAGELIEPTPDAPPEHTEQHIMDSQTPEFQGNAEALKVLLAHVKGEEEQNGITEDQPAPEAQ